MENTESRDENWHKGVYLKLHSGIHNYCLVLNSTFYKTECFILKPQTENRLKFEIVNPKY